MMVMVVMLVLRITTSGLDEISVTVKVLTPSSTLSSDIEMSSPHIISLSVDPDVNVILVDI